MADLQQVGVFGEDKSESDEELLAAIEAIDPSTQPPARGRGRRGRGGRATGDTLLPLWREILVELLLRSVACISSFSWKRYCMSLWACLRSVDGEECATAGGRQGRGRGRGKGRGRKSKGSEAEEPIELADSSDSEDAEGEFPSAMAGHEGMLAAPPEFAASKLSSCICS